MKRFLFVLCGGALCSMMFVNSGFAFSDVVDTHPNYKVISELKSDGIIQGYEDGTFRPDAEINRAEFLKILVGTKVEAAEMENYDNCFDDVKEEWFAPYVCYAKSHGWVEGDGDEGKTFSPNRTVNKVEALKMLYESQYIRFYSESRPVSFENDLEQMVEMEKLNEEMANDAWYESYVDLARDMRILEKGEADFEQAMTRGKSAEYLYRGLNYFDETKNEDIQKLNEFYFKDSKNAYYKDFRTEVMGDVDVESFELAGTKYAKDKDHIYRLSHSIDQADPDSFEVLQDRTGYARDKDRVYLKNGILPYADPDSFEVLWYGISRDKNFNYSWYDLVSGKDAGAGPIEMINGDDNDTAYHYAQDGKYVYFLDYHGHILRMDWVDVDSFEIDKQGWIFQDKNGRYKNHSGDDGYEFEVEECFVEKCVTSNSELYKSSEFKWEDPKVSEEQVKAWAELGYKYDNGQIYSSSGLMYGLDLESFEPINKEYAKDKDHVYHSQYGNWGVMQFADPDSFEVVSREYGKDKENVYYECRDDDGVKMIKGVDLDSFKILGDCYTRDKNHVYYEWQAIEGADVESFAIMGQRRAKDKNHFYLEGKIVDDLVK